MTLPMLVDQERDITNFLLIRRRTELEPSEVSLDARGMCNMECPCVFYSGVPWISVGCNRSTVSHKCSISSSQDDTREGTEPSKGVPNRCF